MRRDLEHQHQKALVTWAGYAAATDPRLRLLYAIPNAGKRSRTVGGRMKAEGLRPGMPDLHLPVPVGRYAGLWIEMKAGKNTTTTGQNYWLETLVEYGHACVVCYGWEAGRRALEVYLRGEWTARVVETIRIEETTWRPAA